MLRSSARCSARIGFSFARLRRNVQCHLLRSGLDSGSGGVPPALPPPPAGLRPPPPPPRRGGGRRPAATIVRIGVVAAALCGGHGVERFLGLLAALAELLAGAEEGRFDRLAGDAHHRPDVLA